MEANKIASVSVEGRNELLFSKHQEKLELYRKFEVVFREKLIKRIPRAIAAGSGGLAKFDSALEEKIAAYDSVIKEMRQSGDENDLMDFEDEYRVKISKRRIIKKLVFLSAQAKLARTSVEEVGAYK